MEQLIPVINKLQDVFNTIGSDSVDLPQIVVIGSQSSGKSSVLENIVGRDFLPRGMGIVTRRPLVLQLINLPPDKVSKDPRHQEWGEFLHKPSDLYYDFNEIREEINRETDRISGRNKGISHVPINLKIYSPHVLNLTLVDLPGITRVPIGDQPSDIEQQIRTMVLQYISRPNAIILAVTAANTDLSNSDALQLAAEVDSEGNRTIGVVTKIDIMDKGTDALDVLLGRVIPLRLGYIGVVNRSQKDIIEKKPIRDALKQESEFFATHPLYRDIATRCGTPYLSRTLNKILMNHIKDCLPELKVRVNKMLADAQNEMHSYGDPLYDGKNSQGALLLQVITKFSSDFRNAIEGKSADVSLQELYGGARINYIFNEIFARCLNEINPHDGMTVNAIRTAIRNATGPRAALFVPEASFELLVKRQITRLEEPALQCVELVYDELQRIVSQLESKELLRFTNLRERVVEVVNNLLQKCRTPSKVMIGNLVSIELSYINTNHPDFVGGGGAISQVFERMAMAHQQEQLALQQGIPAQPTLTAPTTVTATKKKKKDSSNGQPLAMPPSNAMPGAVPPGGVPGGQPGPGKDGFFTMFFGGPGQPPTGGTMAGVNTATPGAKAPATAGPGKAGSKGAPALPPTPQQAPPARLPKTPDGKPAPEKLPQVPSTIKAINTPTDKERFETELIQQLLFSYFNIVRKNVQDLVPKSIMHFLVNQAKDNIQNELVSHLYKEELFDELLEESPAVAQRRRACKQMLDVLRKAQTVLNEVRDIAL